MEAHNNEAARQRKIFELVTGWEGREARAQKKRRRNKQMAGRRTTETGDRKRRNGKRRGRRKKVMGKAVPCRRQTVAA